MSFTIAHYPAKSFMLTYIAFSHQFTIDINQSVQDKLGTGITLTNALALTIFKQIKLKSDVLSFLTKPVVFIPLSIVIFGAGIAIPETGIASTAIGIVLCVIGGMMLGISIREPMNHFLSQISQAYSDQSKRAAEYIKDIQSSNKELVFIFA